MCGEAAARALRTRFEEIRRAELQRLRKKIASLGPSAVAEVDAVTAQVVQAIASRPTWTLRHDNDPPLVDAVLHLFGVANVRDDLPAR
jgi:glutamyl-tRNA reductase